MRRHEDDDLFDEVREAFSELAAAGIAGTICSNCFANIPGDTAAAFAEHAEATGHPASPAMRNGGVIYRLMEYTGRPLFHEHPGGGQRMPPSTLPQGERT